MTTPSILKVGIVGLGQIAQGYDEPTGIATSTHIKACRENPHLEIDWMYDVNEDRAHTVRQRWSLASDVVSSDEALERSADIICIASPDETHGDWITRFLAHPPKMVFCEKPLSARESEARRLIAAAQSAGSMLVINFMRRWLPGVAKWLNSARAGDFGSPLGAQITYCRGLKHNGCHGFDLLGAALGGEVVSVTKAGDVFYDFSADDPTVSAHVDLRTDLGRVPLVLQGVDGRVQNDFDIAIAFDGSRLHIWNDDGMRVHISDEDGLTISEFHDKPARHMQYVWENLVNVALNHAPLVFDASESLPGSSLVDGVADASLMTLLQTDL